MRRGSLLTWAGLLALSASASNAFADDITWVGEQRFQAVSGEWYQLDEVDQLWKVVPGMIVVLFGDEIDSTLAPTQLSELGLSLLGTRPDIGGYFRFSYDLLISPPNILDVTLGADHVLKAYLDTELKFFGDANDTYFANQWNLLKCRTDRAWDITTGAHDVIIAVLDRGFDLDHEDLAESIWTNQAESNGTPGVDDDGNGYVDDMHGWDFVQSPGHPLGDNDPSPSVAGDEHGTACAGIACAIRDNGKGVAGAAGGSPGNRPKLLPLRTTNVSNIGPAIEYAWRAGADAISMSFGSYGDSAGAGSVAIDSVHAHGTVLFAAMGNAGWPYDGFVSFPATHPSVIGVGSTDDNDVRICKSNYGPHLDIVAPSASPYCPYAGPFVWTTDNYSLYGYNPGYPTCDPSCVAIPPENDRYFGRFNGTSAACPLAAGIAALLKSHMPQLTSLQLRQRLQDSAIDLGVPGRDDEYGYGRIDAYRALTEWGTITGNVTWGPGDTHDGARYVSGDLTIAPGATLTILPGTIVRVANEDDLEQGNDPERVEIIVQGTLSAEGTEGDPIVFESWTPTTTADWAGFYFDAQSGGGTFDNCRISRAEYAIESYAPLVVTDTEIDSCSYAGVLSIDGGALIQGCQLSAPGEIGIEIEADAVVVRDTVVDGALAKALTVHSGASLIVRNSVFTNSDTGLYVDGNASVDVDSASYFYANDTGIHFYNAGSSSIIRNSGVAENASTAIFCDNSSHALIDSNIVANNGAGIYCSNGSSPRITRNEIQSSGFAITATSSSNPDVGHYSSSGKNKIAHTGKYVANYTTATIHAQNNCWNKNVLPCRPQPNMFIGAVDTDYPICCEFLKYTGGEGEPEPQGFVFRPEPKKSSVTGLLAVIPNPFNPTTTIHYSLASQSTVEIDIYDVAGRMVEELVRGSQTAGASSVIWNGTDRRGSPVASGIYFVRMAAAGQTFTRKILLLK